MILGYHPSKRAQNQEELVACWRRVKSRPAAEWLAEMDRRQVPCAPINDFSDILHDPHVAHMGLVKTLELPNGAITKPSGFRFPSAFDQIDIQSPPALGADNQTVYDEWLRQDK